MGAILGDGSIYDKRPHYVEMCGNPINDLAYYENVLLPIVREVGKESKALLERRRAAFQDKP